MSVFYYPYCKIRASLTPHLIQVIVEKSLELDLILKEVIIDRKTLINRPLNREEIFNVFSKYSPEEIRLDFELTNIYLWIKVESSKDQELYISIGGDLIDKKKQFIHVTNKDTVGNLDILLHITSPFILTDLKLFSSDYHLFAKNNIHTPGLSAWAILGNESERFFDSIVILDQLALKGFDLFSTSTAMEPNSDEHKILLNGLMRVRSAELYIKWMLDPKGRLGYFSEKPLALLQVFGGIITIKPLEPYRTKIYEGHVGLDLGFYASILLDIVRPFSIDELQYIPETQNNQ